MRILVLSDNFVPERNAPAMRTFDHCKRWVEQGADVTVITGAPNFPTGQVQAPYKNKLYQRETIAGIKVVRVWTYLAPNIGFVRRSVDFFSYAVSAFIGGLREKPDIIIATSPQLLTGMAGSLLALVKRTPWVFEVRDLWPDSITAVHAMRKGPLITFLRWLEGRLYRSATHIVTVSEPLKTAIAARDIDLEKISVTPNGASARLQASEKDEALVAELELKGRFVVGYIGNHGLAQGLEIMVHAADTLRARDDIVFLFVGDGATRPAIIKLAQQLKLSNVRFVESVPSSVVSKYLAVCDALLVPLKKSEIAPGAIPSKIFEAAAMARPILLAISGVSADLVRQYNAGIVIEPENAQALAVAVKSLLSDIGLRNRLAVGCRALALDYDRNKLADQMLEQISQLHLTQLCQ